MMAAKAEAAAERDAAVAAAKADAERDRQRHNLLRCRLSHKPLNDPARGDACTHPALCNYADLRAYVSRAKRCPIVGCPQKLPRTSSVVRAQMPAQVDVTIDLLSD